MGMVRQSNDLERPQRLAPLGVCLVPANTKEHEHCIVVHLYKRADCPGTFAAYVAKPHISCRRRLRKSGNQDSDRNCLGGKNRLFIDSSCYTCCIESSLPVPGGDLRTLRQRCVPQMPQGLEIIIPTLDLTRNSFSAMWLLLCLSRLREHHNLRLSLISGTLSS